MTWRWSTVLESAAAAATRPHPSTRRPPRPPCRRRVDPPPGPSYARQRARPRWSGEQQPLTHVDLHRANGGVQRTCSPNDTRGRAVTTTPTYERAWTHEGRPELNRMGIPAVDGPWMNEPDKVHWIDPATDLDCLMVRNGMGAWCGYVGLPPGHPFHGVGYDQCTKADECGDEWCYSHSPNAAVEVHGGLTFASSCHESDKGEGFGICHVPLPGRPDDVWWLGFDTAHSGDRSPYDEAKAAHEQYRYPWGAVGGEVYRDLDYVKTETANLARQLAAVSA